MMRPFLIWWYRHEAAWARVDAYLARARGDLDTAIEYGVKANRAIHKLNALTNKLWG